MNENRSLQERIGPGAVGMEISHIKTCARCGMRYDWRKSQSTMLKMTYCGSLCEKGALGFTMDALMAFEPAKRDEEPAADAEPVAAAK